MWRLFEQVFSDKINRDCSGVLGAGRDGKAGRDAAGDDQDGENQGGNL